MRVLAALAVLIAGVASAAPVPEADAPAYLQREPALPEDSEQAAEAIVCLHAAVEAQGLAVDLAALRALSGEAWSPLLVTEEPVYEALRERLPLDVLTRGCEALGVEGAWHTGLAPEEILALAAEEIGAQRPVLTSFLLRHPEGPTGWNLAIGTDLGEGDLLLMDRAEPRGRVVMHLARGWTGPVPGPQVWAESPVFAARVTPTASVPSGEAALRLALGAWSEQVSVEALGFSPSAEAFAEGPLDGVTAESGPAAARALADQISGLESLDDYPTLWRVRTLTRLWAERRRAGAEFLRGLSGLGGETGARCSALAASLEEAAMTAQTIRSLMWNESFLTITDAQGMLRRLRREPPLVVDLSGLPDYQRQLLVETIRRTPPQWTMERRSTRWGPCLTIDGPDQRDRVATLLETWAQEMEALDAAALALRGAL